MSEPVEVTMSETANTVDAAATDSRKRAPRERSKIRFPYFDLADAIEVAQTLHHRRGGRCEIHELAAELGQPPTSGTFRLRVSAAGIYGVIQQSKDEGVTLTSLGRRIIDPETEPAARVDAFLNVPLYRHLYEHFKTGTLPGDAGVETQVRAAGVTKNQVARARQVFARSADQAGFFSTGRSRLVKPATASSETAPETEVTLADAAAGRDQERSADPLSNPLLVALFQRMLPPEDKPFTARERSRFFRALAVNLDVIYGEPTDGEIDADQMAKLFMLQPRDDQRPDPSAAHHPPRATEPYREIRESASV